MEDLIKDGVRQVRSLIIFVFDTVENAFMFSALLSLFAMMILTTGNAVARYLYNDPISGSYELTELYLMPMAIFLTAAHLQRNDGNINVDILYDRLPSEGQTFVDLIGQILAVVVFAPIAYRTGLEFWIGYVEGRISVGVIEFPIYLSWLIMSVGLFALSIGLLLQIASNITEIYLSITARDDEVVE